MDAADCRAFTRESSRSAARGEQQSIVRDVYAALGRHARGGAVDRGDSFTEPHFDLAVVVELRRSEIDSIERLLARQVLLRERRSLIRQLRLVADHDDVALETVLTERCGRLAC